MRVRAEMPGRKGRSKFLKRGNRGGARLLPGVRDPPAGSPPREPGDADRNGMSKNAHLSDCTRSLHPTSTVASLVAAKRTRLTWTLTSLCSALGSLSPSQLREHSASSPLVACSEAIAAARSQRQASRSRTSTTTSTMAEMRHRLLWMS